MTYRVGHAVGSLSCALFVVVACGGSSFEEASGSAGAASGASNTAGASGEANAGSANGGTATGGDESGGSGRGGTNGNGGVSNGGVSNGGVSSGGSSNGGVSGGSTACNEDSDCVACAYPTAPTKAADCYCASCAGTPLSKTACAANKAAWEANCAMTPIPCPAIACIVPPVPACRSHMCVAK